MKHLFSSILLLFLTLVCISQTYPPNIFADSAHTPFLHGVTSGDPLTEKVILWTRIEPTNAADSMLVNWQMATDSLFTQAIASGFVYAKPLHDWTVHIDAAGLQPATIYYYRFSDSQGNYSAIGRTQTAPSTAHHLKFAVISCSSIYSGYFNAYARIAERNDLNLVIHLGDYIYDFVDGDEQIRIPDPYPVDPSTLEEYRDRHKYYLLDPDLRAARQQHPWAAIWDNHDVNSGNNLQAIQAFFDYLPIRKPDVLDTNRIYRILHYANLTDIFLLDEMQYRNEDTITGNEYSMLGNTQHQWFLDSILVSDATWKIMASEKLMGQWNVPLISGGSDLTASAWGGFPADRDRIFDFWEQNNIDNVVVISGDSHLTIGCDLTKNPFDENTYNPATGEGSVAVEILPASISRGNLDEMGIAANLIPVVTEISMSNNPHHVLAELTQHGYGILNIRPDSLIAEVWYSEILQQTIIETWGGGLVVRNGDNHWQRDVLTNPPGTDTTSAVTENSSTDIFFLSDIFPSPGTTNFSFTIESKLNSEATMRIFSIPDVRVVNEFGIQVENKNKVYTFELSSVSAGIYFMCLEIDGKIFFRKFVKN